MAHYCVFCDRSFISFTRLRSHQCRPIHQNQLQLINLDFGEEKENWIEQPFDKKSSLSETHNLLTSKTMDENYGDVKSDFEYTIELNEELDPDLRTHINPNRGKILSNNNGSIEINGDINGVPKPTENERESSSGVESEDVVNSDYVYVLEPDESINLQLGDENEPESRNGLNELRDDRVKCEVSEEVLDLSGSGKRKRKSNLASTLSHIHKIKSVCVEQENSDKSEEDNENQANKVHVIERKEITVDQYPNHKSVLSNVINDESPKDLSIKSEIKSEFCAPMYSTPVLNTVNSGSSRKNRRKRSIPVRCEKNEEMCDITDIVEEYGVQPEFKAKTAIQDYAEKGVEFAPIKLAPKSYPPAALSMEKTIVENPFAAPLDLTPSAKTKVVETILKSPPTKPESVQPVDLSKPTNLMLNGLKSEVVNGGLPQPMLPSVMPFDPIQMRQLFEHVYKMQVQFPNQNLVQTQLMQFHALMQNAMLNGGVVPGINLNGKKTSSSVKSDKNDNIVKIEPGTQNDPIANEYQNFNIDTIYKNGLLQNNFAPPFNTSTPGSLPPSSQFTPSPTSQIKNRSVRKKNKEQSLMTESSPDSPKTEGSLPLIALDGKYSPEQILDTLQKYFPVVPIENLPKAQISEDITGNPVKFFVKDNEQIRVIVDSLLVVGVLDLHEQQVQGTEPVYKYICRVCNQTFFHVEHLTKHIKKHHVIKKYQCSECDRSFHDAGNYRQHMRVHDEADVPYECPECNRRFRHKCTLKVHMRIHTGEKPFKCDVCHATFKISSGLQTHMRKHTGETPYACEFCDMRFKCQSNLKQHLFQHTQVRPFPCDMCGKTYSRKSIRDAHLLTHTKDMIKEHVKQWIDDLPEQPVAVGGSD